MPSALQKFLFGEGTPDTYESLQSKRAMAERYAASLSQTPQNLGQGLSALGRAYASRKLMDQANTGDAKGKADFGSAFARIMAGRNVPNVVAQEPTVAEPTPRNVDAQDPRAGEAMYAGTSGANTSKDAELIKSFEGYRDTPYYDVNAYRAGYGSDTTTDQFGNVTPISQGSRVDTESANRDLNRRIVTEFRPKAAKAAGDMWNNLSDAQRASLTSIAYNYGDIPGSVKSALSSGDVGTVSRAIAGLASHNDGINASRRATEASIFSGGDIPKTYQIGLGSTNQGPSVQELVGAMGNPYATPAQKMALGTMLQQKLAANQPMSPQDQLNMEYKQAQIEALKAKQAAAGNQPTEYGLTPQYGVDENGNPVLIQIGKDGTAVRTPLPDGVSLSKQPIKMDAGTHFVLLDPITRQPVGTIPKDNRGEASEKAVGTATGKAQGEAIVNLRRS
jgi:GH24 family phage-related lysozyme (muramidase)